MRPLHDKIMLFPVVFMIAVLLYASCRTFVADQFITPTSSMELTLLPGDRILVDKRIMGARIYSDFHFSKDGQELQAWRTRGLRGIQRNDVVVFNFPYHNGRLNFVINHVFAKRCVALPGDSLSIENGCYKNNNVKGIVGYLPAQHELAAIPDSLFDEWVLRVPPYDDIHFGATIKNMEARYIPRKGDLIRITPREGELYKALLEWETEKEISINWEKEQVTAGGKPIDKHTFQHNYYFMAGDNVMNSSDSRYWGLVPEEYIIGVATCISYSRDKETNEMRKHRILKQI